MPSFLNIGSILGFVGFGVELASFTRFTTYMVRALKVVGNGLGIGVLSLSFGVFTKCFPMRRSLKIQIQLSQFGISYFFVRVIFVRTPDHSGIEKGKFGSHPSACLISFLTFVIFRAFPKYQGLKDLKLCPDLFNVSGFGSWG